MGSAVIGDEVRIDSDEPSPAALLRGKQQAVVQGLDQPVGQEAEGGEIGFEGAARGHVTEGEEAGDFLLPVARLGIAPGLTCRSVGRKLSREGDTGFAPVITLA